MAAKDKIRVLLAKPGLDGHDKGIKMVARALRDAGMEVIYTGMRQTPDTIAQSALQEDADVIGLSILSGAHIPITEKVMRKLKELKISNKLVLVGGVIPTDEDIGALKKAGVNGVFPSESPFESIVKFIEENVKR